METGPALMGGIVFFIIWLLMMIVMFVGYVIILIALWRGMKAHEFIAETLRSYLKLQPSGVPAISQSTEDSSANQ